MIFDLGDMPKRTCPERQIRLRERSAEIRGGAADDLVGRGSMRIGGVHH
jgi:hypothetical protein